MEWIKNQDDEWVANPSKRVMLVLVEPVNTSSTSRSAVSGWSFAAEEGNTYHIKIVANWQTDTVGENLIFGFVMGEGGAGDIVGRVVAGYEDIEVLKDEIKVVSSITDNDETTHFVQYTDAARAYVPYPLSADVVFTCTATETFYCIWRCRDGDQLTLLSGSTMIIEQI